MVDYALINGAESLFLKQLNNRIFWIWFHNLRLSLSPLEGNLG